MAWFAISLFQPFKGESDGARGARGDSRAARASATSPILEDRGVVSNAAFFELRARLAGRSGELKPGAFELREDMSFSAALDALEQGVPPNVVVVTIPEGLLAQGDSADRQGRRSAGQLPARQPAHRGCSTRALRRAGRPEPRGLPVPGQLRAQEGPPARALVTAQLEGLQAHFAKVDLRLRPAARTSRPTTC